MHSSLEENERFVSVSALRKEKTKLRLFWCSRLDVLHGWGSTVNPFFRGVPEKATLLPWTARFDQLLS